MKHEIEVKVTGARCMLSQHVKKTHHAKLVLATIVAEIRSKIKITSQGMMKILCL